VLHFTNKNVPQHQDDPTDDSIDQLMKNTHNPNAANGDNQYNRYQRSNNIQYQNDGLERKETQTVTAEANLQMHIQSIKLQEYEEFS